MTNMKKRWLCIIPVLCWTPKVFADYKNDIGYGDLQSLLGAGTPSGAGVNVIQAEASTVLNTDGNFPIYAPDPNHAQFADDTFLFPGTASTSPSSHATGVGALFYGSNAMAHGIDTITSYEVNDWISSLYNPNGTVAQPVNGSRIANHSWVGTGNTPTDTGNILRLVDRQVQLNEFIQVVGVANGTSNNPLLGSAYNVIAVGRTDGNQDKGSDAVDSVYVAGRTRPDLVAPETTTSAATPLVSAAAALLVETGHNAAATLSNGSTGITGVGTVYNAERSETVKAALMAGADRATDNSSTTANITDYRRNGHASDNGLDDRFGAGQLNILHSYQIIAGGEQDSLEDGGSGLIGTSGFDYDAAFGGRQNSNNIATYTFDATETLNFTASLVWNLGVSNNSNLTTTLYNLDLELFDVTTQSTAASSAGTLDNTENLWLTLTMGHSYELLVKSAESSNFSWDYSLAWYMGAQAAPVPLPAAFYLFASGLAGLGFTARRKKPDGSNIIPLSSTGR
ncbi:MAG: VPLPA-CTERM sorting domain-containing protein [Methylomonas sp.]|uniref:VPLPA-CTERM sorting domain-containing protein n=1 Tax=Methylomonas sp. TaxID=418 RepID=UPI0025FBF15E|nr:VPLPA-CTERM sorting domain-containing protein [Methylomonas sp.]MCK9607330.1 VPLPA-CTERM sorting domain-containing protein [Methylomonas sp.]